MSRRRRIERRHSQKMALRFLSLTKPDPGPLLLGLVTELTDHFQQDLDADVGGGNPASPGGDSVSGKATVEVSADMERKRQKEEGGLYQCPTCGEPVRHYGQRCDRCKRNIEEDRLNRGE